MLAAKNYDNFKIIKSLQENKFQYASVLIIFILMMLRQWYRIKYPTLYAEDGALFFVRSAADGYSAILKPYAGYFQVAPTLISLFSYHITLMYYPILTLFISSFIYVAAISTVTRSSYSWINSNHIVRFFLALSLTVLPGTPEILGNLANLHTVLFIFVTFRMLAKFEETYSAFDYILFALTAFSAGEFFLILPILLYRMFVVYKSKLSSTHMLQYIFILLITSISIAVTVFTAIWAHVSAKGSLAEYIVFLKGYLPALLLTINNRIFYLPFLGNLTIELNQHGYHPLISSVILMCITGLILIKSKMYDDRYLLLLLIVLVSQMLEIILTVSVRAGIADIIGKITSTKGLWVRYSIYMMPFVMIFWQIFVNDLLKKLNINSKIINIILVFISLYALAINSDRVVFRNFYRIPGENLEEKYLWPYNARLIYNITHYGKPETSTILIAPLGWLFPVSYVKK